MEKISLQPKQTYLSSLSESERQSINSKVQYEPELSNYQTLKKMTVVGGLSNALAGLFIIWSLDKQINHTTLVTWYVFILAFNLINILWSAHFGYRYENMNADLLKKWHTGLYYILAGLSLVWGSIGILFLTYNPFYQLYVITFLQIALLCFSVGSIFDFFLSVLCASCLLLPTATYYLFNSLYQYAMLGHDNFLTLAFAISLLILGAFIIIVCFMGNRLSISQATYAFLNEALNEKLSSMNKILERRVRERTIELEKLLGQVTYQATHDLLTGLPNHQLLIEYLKKAIDASNRHNHVFGIAFYSINELEKITDGLGYRAGEQVIQAVAKRITKYFLDHTSLQLEQHHDKVALSRKDTFAIILDPVTNPGNIENDAAILFSVLDMPVYTDKQTIKLTASVGIALYPNHGNDIQTLLMNADAAMLKAKQHGGNSICQYQADINASLPSQLELESGLYDAIKNTEFCLQYQPFSDLRTNMIGGFEALVRWHHPTLGLVSPAQFIPLAEANGTIVPLGEWVLRSACKQLKAWHMQGFDFLEIAINFSAKQLIQKNILEMISDMISDIGINTKYITLEPTEAQAFKRDVIPILRQLKKMGFGLAIDDFGTGYSGLSNLKLVKIDYLKIDQSFVRDVEKNKSSMAIVSNIVNLARKLNIKVIAEGVETKQQLQIIKEHDCDIVQGFYFSPPVNPEDILHLLENQK